MHNKILKRSSETQTNEVILVSVSCCSSLVLPFSLSYFPSCALTFTCPCIFLALPRTLLTVQRTVLFHSLNDRTQTASRFTPGAALSRLKRYTQQHLSVCPWKWDCLCARECLCITHSSCVYAEWWLDKVEQEKLQAAFSGVRYFPSMGRASTQNTNTHARTHNLQWIGAVKHQSVTSQRATEHMHTPTAVLCITRVHKLVLMAHMTV